MGHRDLRIMGLVVGCPFEKWENASITLPDEWLGQHAQIRDEAVESAIKRELNTTLTQFAIALALLDDWKHIPGIDGPPEKWDLEKIPLEMIAWISQAVLTPFSACFEVPKVSSSLSGDGSTET